MRLFIEKRVLLFVRGLRCAWRWWLTDVVGLQVGLGVVERGGRHFELFGSAPKISKLNLILGGRAAKNNLAADSPPARPSARPANESPTPRSTPAAQRYNSRLSTHANWQDVVN